MKVLSRSRCIGVLFLFLLLLPNMLILPSLATSHSIYDNYESEITTGVINTYYQSSSAFQSVQEGFDLTNSTLRIIVGASFYYNTSGASIMQIQAVDNSSGLLISSQNHGIQK